MRIAKAAALAACLGALCSCGSRKPTPEATPSARPSATATSAGAQPERTPGPPVTDASIAASRAYAQGADARAALAAAPPQVAGVPKEALSSAAELAVCRISFAVKHGEPAHAPSEVEIRQAAFDLASDPKALEECRSRG